MSRPIRNRYRVILLAVLLVATPALAGSLWTLDWWTLDGGGEVFTTGGSWELSGSIGQWDASSHTRSRGGSWEVTGGFWSIAVTESDHLFSDGFE